MGGQHAVDEFFCRRESLVALEREFQEGIEEECGSAHIIDQSSPVIVVSYRDPCVRVLEFHNKVCYQCITLINHNIA